MMSGEAKEREGAKERELFLRASETAEQREERLSRRRIRDRARRAVQRNRVQRTAWVLPHACA